MVVVDRKLMLYAKFRRGETRLRIKLTVIFESTVRSAFLPRRITRQQLTSYLAVAFACRQPLLTREDVPETTRSSAVAERPRVCVCL